MTWCYSRNPHNEWVYRAYKHLADKLIDASLRVAKDGGVVEIKVNLSSAFNLYHGAGVSDFVWELIKKRELRYGWSVYSPSKQYHYAELQYHISSRFFDYSESLIKYNNPDHFITIDYAFGYLYIHKKNESVRQIMNAYELTILENDR